MRTTDIAGKQQDGCYEKQGQVILVGATDMQIRECISLCSNNLRVLELSQSGITEIPDNIRNINSLRYLGLRGLHLKELPDWLPEIAELFSVDALNDVGGRQKAVVNLLDTTVEDVDMSIFEQPYEIVVKLHKCSAERNRTHWLSGHAVAHILDTC